MTVIYDNQVKAMGDCVAEFEDSGMFILFGDDAPDTLKDYCYSIDVNPIQEQIRTGQKAVIDGKEYKIKFGYRVLCKTDLIDKVINISKEKGGNHVFIPAQVGQHPQFDLGIVGIHKYASFFRYKNFADQAAKFHSYRNILEIRLRTAQAACCGNRLVKAGINALRRRLNHIRQAVDIG